jgi:PilZ domain
VEHRSQKRTATTIPIQVRGVDAQGDSFEEWIDALEVSRRGLSVMTRRDLPLHAELSVTIPGRGPMRPAEGPSDFFAKAAVVRVEKEGEMYRVGIRFVGATLSTFTSEAP